MSIQAEYWLILRAITYPSEEIQRCLQVIDRPVH